MGTLMDKLNATNATKEQIRQAIERKKVSVPAETPLKDYPAKIDGIYPDALFLQNMNISGNLPIALSWRTICSNDKKIVMAGCSGGSGGTNKILCADKNGWKAVNAPRYAPWSHSVYGNGKFLIGADYTKSDQNIIYSSDGQSWKTAKMPFSATVQGFVFDGKKFVAKTSDGVIFSNDGITWKTIEAQPPKVSENTGTMGQKRIVYEFGEYFVMCTYADFYKSKDLKNWTRISFPWSVETPLIASGNGAIMVISSGSAGTIGHTVDGVNWDYSQYYNTNNVYSLECVRGVFTYVKNYGEYGRTFIKITPDNVRHDLAKVSDAQFLRSHLLGEGLGILISVGSDSGGSRAKDSNKAMLGYDFANWTDNIKKSIEDADGVNKTGDVLNALNAISARGLQVAYQAGVNSI